MRILPIVLAAWTISAGVAVHAQEPAVSHADDTAIRDVVRKYVDAREAGVAKDVAALFTASADQLVSSGEWRQGRDNVVSGSMASSAQSGGKRTIDVERVRMVSKDVAIADGRYAITGVQGGDRRMWSTFVMVRESGGWKISAIRNMLPAVPVAQGK